MTTERLISIASAALCDAYCHECDNEGKTISCFDCRVNAAKEIGYRLREHSDMVLGIKKKSSNEKDNDEIISECPFCGGIAIGFEKNSKYKVMCPQFVKEPMISTSSIVKGVKEVVKGCGASTGYHDTLGEAIEAWNMRAGNND